MRKNSKSSQGIQVSIGGDVSGQFAVGEDISQMSVKTGAVSKAELKELHQMLKALKAKVKNESQPEKKNVALEHVQELEQAITQKKPDVSKMASVRNWFVKNLPGLVG